MVPSLMRPEDFCLLYTHICRDSSAQKPAGPAELSGLMQIAHAQLDHAPFSSRLI